MKILCILQNQWFKEPERVKEMYERTPDLRNELIRRFLFMGCKTGKVLQETFGPELCRKIIWEETSPEIESKSNSCPPVDLKHIMTAIIKHQPDAVITLGRTASNGLLACTAQYGQHTNLANFEAKIQTQEPKLEFTLLCGPHPAARNNPIPRLREIKERIDSLKQQDKLGDFLSLDEEVTLPE